MKILWVEDMNCFEAFGGTAQNDRLLFMEGIKRGYDIHIVTPQSMSVVESDLAILHNITMFNKDWLLKLADSKYIMHFHDFPCKYRLFWPMLDKCKRCPDRNFWLTLLTKAKANFFLSPLHKWAVAQVYPEVEDIPYYLVPSAMNPEPFLKAGSNPGDRANIIAVNSLYSFKGKDNVLNYAKDHPELQFTFVGGKEDDVVLPPNCHYAGLYPHEVMPKLYARHKSFIHLANSVDPFNQATVEAYISGCSLIVNKLVGCTSWDWFTSREKVVENVSKSKDLFWDEVEAIER